MDEQNETERTRVYITTHAKIAALKAAQRAGMYLERWVSDAILEKVARENGDDDDG